MGWATTWLPDKMKIGGKTFYEAGWHLTASEAKEAAEGLRRRGFKVRTIPRLADRRYMRYVNYTRPEVKGK